MITTQLKMHVTNCKTRAMGKRRYTFYKTMAYKGITYCPIFVWTIMLNILPTKDNLKHKGFRLENNICLMCGESEETTNHLIFECKIVAAVRSMDGIWIGISNVYHNQTRTHFQHFHRMKLNNKGNII